MPDARRAPLRRADERRLLRRAWDRFANARGARRATPRELRIRAGQLEASLLAEERFDLGAAIADHEALRAALPAHREKPPRDPWAWLRPGRRSTEDERALWRLEAELEARRERAPIG